MTGEPKALRVGRERYQRQLKATRQREAVKRVRAYRRWLKAGSPIGRIPAIPSTADFRRATGRR